MHGAMHGGVRKHNNKKHFQQSEVLKSTAVCVLAAWHKKRNFGDGADNSSFAYLKGIEV